MKIPYYFHAHGCVPMGHECFFRIKKRKLYQQTFFYKENLIKETYIFRRKCFVKKKSVATIEEDSITAAMRRKGKIKTKKALKPLLSSLFKSLFILLFISPHTFTAHRMIFHISDKISVFLRSQDIPHPLLSISNVNFR